MSDLTEFLLARIAEDEAAARQGLALQDPVPDIYGVWGHARVLAECDAKRRIVTTYLEMTTDVDTAEYMIAEASVFRSALLDLAAIYADHPDYQEAWKLESRPANAVRNIAHSLKDCWCKSQHRREDFL